MTTGTSGVSALTGGNCTQEEHEAYVDSEFRACVNASDRMTTPELYDLLPVPKTPTTGDALAADLQTPFTRFAEVFRREGIRLSDEAHAQMEQGLAELGSTINALRR
jgi:hypothetical protein